MTKEMLSKSKERIKRLSQFVTQREDKIKTYYQSREKNDQFIYEYYKDKIELE